MTRVLFLTRHYLDENNGGSNGTKAYLRAIRELYDDVTLIYPEHTDGDSTDYVSKGVKFIPCYDNRKRWQKGIDIYRGRLHRAIGFVKQHLKENRYDITI